MRAATVSVGLVSPRSTCESMGALTPLRSERSRSDSPADSRSALTRAPITAGDSAEAWSGGVSRVTESVVIQTYAITDATPAVENCVPSDRHAVRVTSATEKPSTGLARCRVWR